MDPRYDENQLLVFAQAMANVAASDGRVTDDERDQLDDLIMGLGLSPRDERVTAVVEAEFKAPGNLTDIVSRLKAKELKAALLRMLVEVSCADGDIHADERGKVREAAAAFGFDPKLAEDLIEWAIASIHLEQREQELMGKLLA